MKLVLGALLGIMVLLQSCGIRTELPDSPVNSEDKGGVSQSDVTIIIQPGSTGRGSSAFGANPRIVLVNTSVTWVNQDSTQHSIVSSSGRWDSGPIGLNKSFTFVFNETGDFPYTCGLHGGNSESGVIRVVSGFIQM